MTEKKPDGGPAFAHGNPEQGGDPGMSLRQYAAIHLCVPDSGLDWLDEMIGAARRDRFAGQALAALAMKMGEEREEAINNLDADAGWEAALAYRIADAMLAERDKT